METQEKFDIKLPVIQATSNVVMVKTLFVEGFNSGLVGLNNEPLLEAPNKNVHIVVSIGPEALKYEPRLELGMEIIPPQIPQTVHGETKLIDAPLQYVRDHYIHETYCIIDVYQIYGLNMLMKEFVNLIPPTK